MEDHRGNPSATKVRPDVNSGDPGRILRTMNAVVGAGRKRVILDFVANSARGNGRLGSSEARLTCANICARVAIARDCLSHGYSFWCLLAVGLGATAGDKFPPGPRRSYHRFRPQ